MEQDPGPCPRVNFALMERYVGRSVLLVCKMVNVEGSKAEATTSDNGRVFISLKQSAVDTDYVEFQGIVEGPNQLRETDRSYFGANFDMGTYNELCTLANTQYSSLFI